MNGCTVPPIVVGTIHSGCEMPHVCLAVPSFPLVGGTMWGRCGTSLFLSCWSSLLMFSRKLPRHLHCSGEFLTKGVSSLRFGIISLMLAPCFCNTLSHFPIMWYSFSIDLWFVFPYFSVHNLHRRFVFFPSI